MHDIAKVPMPFTFEVGQSIISVWSSTELYGHNSTKLIFADIQIYGDEKASTDDCFKMFNPVDKTTFDVGKSSIPVPTIFLVVLFLFDNHRFCQQRVINKWCMAFLILFEEGLRNLQDSQIVSQGALDNWVPIGGDVERNVERKSSRERRKLEGLDLGMQELRTYFRLFMVSTFLLMFMFCTRISKNRNRDSGNAFDP